MQHRVRERERERESEQCNYYSS